MKLTRRGLFSRMLAAPIAALVAVKTTAPADNWHYACGFATTPQDRVVYLDGQISGSWVCSRALSDSEILELSRGIYFPLTMDRRH